MCDGIKEPARVGAEASTQGGAERVNEQMGVVLGWKMLQTLAQSPDTLPSLVSHQYTRQEGVLLVDTPWAFPSGSGYAS